MTPIQEEGRARRTLTNLERSGWQAHVRERRRVEERDALLRVIAAVVLALLTIAGLGALLSRSAHASGWGTLPPAALRVCFVDDGQWECLNRVSDFDTLRFCPGTGDALNQPSPPGVIRVGFTDPATGAFTEVRAQPYQWRQLQPYEGRIVVGLDESVAGASGDGFEDCDEYRT